MMATKRRHRLSLPQLRVLDVLMQANGPLTRGKIAFRLGATPVYVGRTVGYSDPVRRRAFEMSLEGGGRPELPNPTLLTLGYIEEITLDIDGVTELGILITPEGRDAYNAHGEVILPPLS